jgi:hypothetical protein
MKRLGLIAVVAALAAASVFAQQQFDPAVPRGLPETRVEPSGELAQPPQSAAPMLVMSPRHRNDADARQCLQLTSNRQIHRCAERYRSHAARAQVTKASVRQADTVRSADRAKASDLAKPDMSKAAEPAKPVDTAKVAPSAPAAPAKAAEAPKAAVAPEKSMEKSKAAEGMRTLMGKGERLKEPQ